MNLRCGAEKISSYDGHRPRKLLIPTVRRTKRKQMKLKASIAALILVSAGTTVNTYARRCGGDLTYFLRNTKGEIIDEQKIDLRYVQNSGTYSPKDLITYPTGQVLGSVYLGRDTIDQTVIDPEKRSEPTEWVKILRVGTACGKSLIEIELEHENQIMVIRFLNIPAETNFCVDSIPFQAGTFEMDFKRDMSLKYQKLNREGLRSKAGTNFLRGTAQTGLLVSAENWIRTPDQKRRKGKLAKLNVEP